MDSESKAVSLQDQTQICIINKVLDKSLDQFAYDSCFLVNAICEETSTNKSNAWKGKIIENSHGSKDKTSQEIVLMSNSDIILGVQWLTTLGPVLIDYSNLKKPFTWERQRVLLQGIRDDNIVGIFSSHLQEVQTKILFPLSAICN